MCPEIAPFDPILDRTNDRFTVFPIQFPRLWEFYKQAQASIWFSEEVDLAEDVDHWRKKLTDNERYYLTHVLAFFAASDGIVMENLAAKFSNDVAVPEARHFYAAQLFIEAVHAETYAQLIEAFVADKVERARVFNAVAVFPCVAAKAEWAQRWIDGDKRDLPFCDRLVAFACVEGIFFSASFCAIFWFKKRGLMPGLCFSNELIARDEGMHRDFACELHKNLTVRCAPDTITEIVREAVDIEKAFVRESLPVHLIGMNADSMSKYVEFVADHLLVTLDVEKTFNTQNPFDFMETISLSGKTNFFERRVSEYKRYAVSKGRETQKPMNDFKLDEEF